jgi:hypothetical protein
MLLPQLLGFMELLYYLIPIFFYRTKYSNDGVPWSTCIALGVLEGFHWITETGLMQCDTLFSSQVKSSQVKSSQFYSIIPSDICKMMRCAFQGHAFGK